MKQVYDKIWIQDVDDKGNFVSGFNQDFLDIVHSSFQILPGKFQSQIKMGDPLMVLETEEELVVVKSPHDTLWVTRLDNSARDFPDLIQETDVVLSLTNVAVPAPTKKFAPRLIMGVNFFRDLGGQGANHWRLHTGGLPLGDYRQGLVAMFGALANNHFISVNQSPEVRVSDLLAVLQQGAPRDIPPVDQRLVNNAFDDLDAFLEAREQEAAVQPIPMPVIIRGQ